MRADAARAAAVDWVTRCAVQLPGFVGAYFSGSTIYLPDDAEVPVGSDVDVMIIGEREGASHRGKFVHRGALIEASHHPWSRFASLETVPSAHSPRLDLCPRGRPAVGWAKFRALSEGAKLATEQLW